MTTYSSNSPVQSLPPRNLLHRAWTINKPLTAVVLLTIVITILASVGIAVDSRTITGLPLWAKPAKFALSIAIYCATILWLFGSINPRPRWVSWLLNISAFTLLAEIVVIVIQALRMQTSHYNMTTAFNAVMWSIMGTSIYILFAISIVAAIMLARQKLPGSRTFNWSLKLGMIITVLAGYGVANFMVQPTDAQMQKMVNGEPDAGSIIGAHTVGAEDGGPGLPILGWSTTHGDFRPAHFFGLHALQVIPLLGLAIARRREGWLREGHRLVLVVIAALAYTGFVGLTTWQALRAEPLIYPSTTTLTALVGLIGTTIVAVSIALLHAYRTHH